MALGPMEHEAKGYGVDLNGSPIEKIEDPEDAEDKKRKDKVFPEPRNVA